jgi:hypothetical protein
LRAYSLTLEEVVSLLKVSILLYSSSVTLIFSHRLRMHFSSFITNHFPSFRYCLWFFPKRVPSEGQDPNVSRLNILPVSAQGCLNKFLEASFNPSIINPNVELRQSPKNTCSNSKQVMRLIVS